MARIEQEKIALTYRVYVTDSLKALTGTSVRYADIFMPDETRTGDEIIESMKEKLRRLGD